MEANKKASIVAAVGGLFLIVSGFSGAYRWERVINLVERLVGSNVAVRVLSYALVSLASAGGLLVLLAAVLFYGDRIRTGKALIWIGTGFGFISFILFVILHLEKVENVILSGIGFGLLGIVLCIWSTTKARPKPI